MFRTRKQSLLGELIVLRATGKAGSPSALLLLQPAGEAPSAHERPPEMAG